jgi:hypothetical protein
MFRANEAHLVRKEESMVDKSKLGALDFIACAAIVLALVLVFTR